MPTRPRASAAALTLSLTVSLAAACGPSTSAMPDALAADAIENDGASPGEDAADDVSLPDDAALADDGGAGARPMVATASGPVRGTASARYREFLGIPYAAPPVGALRWKAPQPVTSWSAPRDVTRTPSRCPQVLLTSASGDEDCLYLNVHTPNPAPARAPVLVWFHGGAFVFGEGTQTDGGTRGDVLASTQGVVVVSVNYRLGALGFMAHPALTTEGGGHSGNYGLLDQRAALQWVRDNIAAFGGDPSNVTIFGESAGGMSVCAHMASPMSAGLFQRAVVQSGPCGLPMRTLAQAETDGARAATALGCGGANTLECLRAAPASRVLAALPTPPGFFSNDPMYVTWSYIVDGAFLPEPLMTRFRAGTFQRVPVVFGFNRDEGTLFVQLAGQLGLTAAQYPLMVRALVNNDEPRAAQVLARYPLGSYPAPWQAFSAVLGDFALRCAARRAFTAMLPHLPSAYTYQFEYPDAAFQLPSTVSLGAFHSAEIQFVFGHPARIGSSRFLGDELALHEAMRGYWARFATTGDPNGAGALAWPGRTGAGAGDVSLTFDRTIRTANSVAADTCAFWESLGLYP